MYVRSVRDWCAERDVDYGFVLFCFVVVSNVNGVGRALGSSPCSFSASPVNAGRACVYVMSVSSWCAERGL